MEFARGILGCFIFIDRILWSFVTINNEVADLPDDIVIDILSRLPAHCIQRCQMVCKNWRVLTSTSQFVEMQIRRAESMIFMQCADASGSHPFHLQVFDEKVRKFKIFKFKPKPMAANTKKLTHLKLRCSYCGLLVFQDYPLSKRVVIIYPFTGVDNCIFSPLGFLEVCGLFFQPLASEYKILIYSYRKKDYFVYGSKSLTWRNITFGSFTLTPQEYSPVILNQALHWIVNPNSIGDDDFDPCMHAVMVFDIESEKFRTMPHPNIEHDHSRFRYIQMYLFEKDESLYLCSMLEIYSGPIEMWQLEDYQNWIWVKRYKLGVWMLPYPSDMPLWGNFFPNSYMNISIVSLNKEELLIKWFDCGLYIMNVNQNTVLKLENPCGQKLHCCQVLMRSKVFTSRPKLSTFPKSCGH